MSDNDKDFEEFDVKSPTGETKHYKMKYALWMDDQALLRQLRDATGQPNMAAIWITRISRATGIGENEIKKMKAWEMSTLIEKWLIFNDVNPTNFLETEKQLLQDTLNTITSLKPNSTSQNPN